MTKIAATVETDLSHLRKFRDAVQSGGGPIESAVKQWGFRYRSFAQRRFARYSRGGGWAPLRRKRSRGSLSSAAVLRDTNTMFAALAPAFANLPGSLEQKSKWFTRVGYGGPMRHASGGRATIADIASFHQVGAGTLPVRKIIVKPDAATVKGMQSDAVRALKKLNNDS